MAKIVVFDLDDTLYKEIDYLKSAYCEIASKLEEYGVDNAYSQMIEWYKDKQNVFDLINSTYGLDISLQTYLGWYRNHKPTIQLSSDAKELLDAILMNEDKVGLITDGRSVTQRNKIEALGLADYIQADDIIISEEFGTEKPNIRNYQYFMEKYPDCELVYVADNPKKDFVTPNKLGWQTIGVLDDGQNIHSQDLSPDKEFLPQKWVKTLNEIITIII